MFLGAVSTLRERQSSARSSSGAGTTSGDGGVSFTKIEGYEDEDLPRLKKSEFRLEKKGPLLFVSDENVPTRETIMSFFHVCTELMLDEEWLEYIIRQSETAGKPLQFAAMDFQRNVMENNFQIEANFGCTYLSKLPVLFQSDDELIAAAKRFMFTCLRSFIEAVKLRSRRFKVLRSSGGFSKISMLEFFEGCNAKMAMPETKEFLRSVYSKTGQAPGPAVIQLQRQLLERFGVTADYGVSMLNTLSSKRPNPEDMEVMQKMQQFAMCAQTATKEATFTDAEREAFYADIPPFMHHVPFMHVAQKQQQMMMDMQNQQMAMADQIANLKRNPENVAQMQDFARRANMAKEKVDSDVASWSAAKRSEYFASFQEDPILREIISVGPTLVAKLRKFSQLTQEQVERMMTVSAVIAYDVRARGNIIQTMGKGGVMQSVLQSWSTIVRAGMQSLSGGEGDTAFGFANQAQSMDHGHGMHGGGAGHVHGPHCSHGGATLDHSHDVSSGRTDEMER